MSCAGTVDPILLETSLNDAQNAISEARRMEAEEYATETFSKATRLFEGAQQAQRDGDGILSIELAFWAGMESQVAGAQTRQRIAKNRIDEADAETLRAVIQEMEYKTRAAQVRQLIAEEKTRRALARALRAEQQAIAAHEESIQARKDTQNTLFRTQIQVAIERVNIILDNAKEAGALTYAEDNYRAAKDLVAQASAAVAQGNFEEAKSLATQAENDANKAKIAAVAGASADASESQAAKLEAHTNAKVALAQAQFEIDRAEKVNAFEHAAEVFQRAMTSFEGANIALKRKQYDQAVRLAMQAESSAHDAFSTAEPINRERLAREALEEQIAQAKDTVFRAEEALNEQASAATTLLPVLHERAKTLLSDAKKAIADENYTHAITAAQQSYDRLRAAIEKGKEIEAAEGEILEAATAVSDAETGRTEKGTLIRFSGDLFQQGSSSINPKFFPKIDQLAEVLKTFTDYQVRIEGHSDSSGGIDVNLRLTQRRADAFKKYLAEKCGVPLERMTAIGLGEATPIADNNFQVGRDRNRRIDTILLTREIENQE
ncbi:OmpA family protein [Candidatus Poribacteria bacterium]|nr:OmpA family protein [Candidatus Poribacteria bacterium]